MVLLSIKLTCNQSKKALQLPAKFFPSVFPWKYNRYIVISRKSSIQTKHESITTKGTKYTMNKNKLTFMPAFFSATFNFRGSTWTNSFAKNAGRVHSPRALVARVIESLRFWANMFKTSLTAGTWQFIPQKSSRPKFKLPWIDTNLKREMRKKEGSFAQKGYSLQKQPTLERV